MNAIGEGITTSIVLLAISVLMICAFVKVCKEENINRAQRVEIAKERDALIFQNGLDEGIRQMRIAAVGSGVGVWIVTNQAGEVGFCFNCTNCMVVK